MLAGVSTAVLVTEMSVLDVKVLIGAIVKFLFLLPEKIWKCPQN